MIEIILFTCMLLLFVIDFLFKESVEEHLRLGEERSILRGKVLLRRVHNEGMALNLFDRYPKVVKWVSAVIYGVMSIYYIVLLFFKGNYGKKLWMTIFMGGALSNVYDRVVRKKVVDYFGFKTKWKKFSNITFNLGDLFIFAGTLLYMVTAMFHRRK